MQKRKMGNNHCLMVDLAHRFAEQMRGVLARLGLPQRDAVLQRISPPREWGYTTTLPQELSGLALADELEKLEHELGKKAARQAMKDRAAKLAAGLAQQLAGEIEAAALPGIGRVEAEGGYLNLYLEPAQACRDTIAAAIEAQPGFGPADAKPERVMLEFSQPNTHKSFHIGHLRNVLLGNALANLYEFAGFEVLRANYYGDHGIHVAKALWGILHPHLLTEAEGILGGLAPEGVYARVERMLTEECSSSRMTELKAQAEAGIARILRELDDPSSDLYQHYWLPTRDEDLGEFRSIYRELGVRFDVEFFESEVEKLTGEIVKELLELGVATVEQAGEYAGTVVVDFAARGLPELGKVVIRRSDGTTLYQTKELALARVKFRDYRVDRSLYVVGSEQNLYFQQVFKILELWGFKEASKCRHISYQLVQLASGKMSSREGTVVPYRAFIREAETRALALARERGISGCPDAVAHQVALGAVKYAFLRVDTDKAIIFDWEQALSFDGNAGPYLQYAYARSNKLLVDYQWDGARLAELGYSPEPAEVGLCRTLAEFPDRVAQALAEHAPNLVANYLYDLTRSFTDFYQACPVLKADADTRFFRQSLVQAFNSVLSAGAGLLGMELPEEM